MSDESGSSSLWWVAGGVGGLGVVAVLGLGALFWASPTHHHSVSVGTATSVGTAPPTGGPAAAIERTERVNVAGRLSDDAALASLLADGVGMTIDQAIAALGIPTSALTFNADDDLVHYEFEIVAPAAGLMIISCAQREVTAIEFNPEPTE